jgi:aspartokinase
VAIIGNQLSKACGVGKEVFGVLEPFNLRMICYGRQIFFYFDPTQ